MGCLSTPISLHYLPLPSQKELNSKGTAQWVQLEWDPKHPRITAITVVFWSWIDVGKMKTGRQNKGAMRSLVPGLLQRATADLGWLCLKELCVKMSKLNKCQKNGI